MHARLRRWSGVVALAAAMLLSGCGYNAIQQKDEAVNAGWSEVLNQYQRRADLVPNLVNTVKGYAAHESQVLTEVTEERARVGQVQVNADDAASLAQGLVQLCERRHRVLIDGANWVLHSGVDELHKVQVAFVNFKVPGRCRNFRCGGALQRADGLGD